VTFDSRIKDAEALEAVDLVDGCPLENQGDRRHRETVLSIGLNHQGASESFGGQAEKISHCEGRECSRASTTADDGVVLAARCGIGLPGVRGEGEPLTKHEERGRTVLASTGERLS
jgi:hypothetical protein